jgi:hypothetical protein
MNFGNAITRNKFIDAFLLFFIKRKQIKNGLRRFGSFTANFKALPPPIPGEYVATLLGVVATAFVGSWLTPSLIVWRKAKKTG